MYGLYVDQTTGGVFLSDMQTCRWLRTNRALAHAQAMMTVFGFNPNGTAVPQQELKDGVFGTLIDAVPWDPNGAADAQRMWAYQVQANGWPLGAAWQYLVDGRVSANTAAAYSQQAAENTAPGGATASLPPPQEFSMSWTAPEVPEKVPTLPDDQIENAPAKGRRSK